MTSFQQLHKIKNSEKELMAEEQQKDCMRVYLYLQLKYVSRDFDSDETLYELKLLHPKNTIKCLSDDIYAKGNVINLNDFKKVGGKGHFVSRSGCAKDSYGKPTFSVAIEQDSIDDVEIFSNTPLTLILYEQNKIRPSLIKRASSSSIFRNTSSRKAKLPNIDADDDSDGKSIKSTSSVKSIRSLHDQSSVQTTRDSRNISTSTPTALAEGYIDLFQFFHTKRIQTTIQVFVHSLNPKNKGVTFYTMWDVYSLMPLTKNLKFSNAIYISFISMYNVPNDILNNCEHLSATISIEVLKETEDVEMQSEKEQMPKLPQQYKQNKETAKQSKTTQMALSSKQQPKPQQKTKKFIKLSICEYHGFWKGSISEQNCTIRWENLKDSALQNYTCLGICTDMKYRLNRILTHLIYQEDVKLDIRRINFNQGYALLCNGLHRFILTEQMHYDLQQYLITETCRRPKNLLIEIFDGPKEYRRLLWFGYLDVSVFLYPHVNSCPFAVKLERVTSTLTPKVETNSRLAQQPQDNDNENQTFAVVKICLKQALTETAKNLYENLSPEYDVYRCCQSNKEDNIPQSYFDKILANSYSTFDASILQFARNIRKLRIAPGGAEFNTKQNNQYLCDEKMNMINNILPLIVHDINKRHPTKTNREFFNLMTIIYKELVERIYLTLETDPYKTAKELNTTYESTQLLIAKRIGVAKYLSEVGDLALSNHLINELKENYPSAPKLKFFIFLYNIERCNFDKAQEYLKRPLRERDIEGERFTKLVTIYMNYMEDRNKREMEVKEKEEEEDISEAKTEQEPVINVDGLGKGGGGVDEKLLISLREFCEETVLTFHVGWMILYCLYKNCDYHSGIDYTRWHLDTLRNDTLHKLKNIPFSLWEIYNGYIPKFKTTKGKYFWKGIELLLQLGLYHFAELLFDEVSGECLDAERYIMKTTFKILTNTMNEDFESITQFEIPLEQQFEQPISLNYSIHITNGHIACHVDGINESSVQEYKYVLNKIGQLGELYFGYQFTILRYAYCMMANHSYKEALWAFRLANNNNDHGLITCAGEAEALYFLGHLEEAKEYFVKLTYHNVYNPNVWAYLALIHLRLADNYKALQCWRYANINPDNRAIRNDIIEELNKINYDNINLFVDEPDIS